MDEDELISKIARVVRAVMAEEQQQQHSSHQQQQQQPQHQQSQIATPSVSNSNGNGSGTNSGTGRSSSAAKITDGNSKLPEKRRCRESFKVSTKRRLRHKMDITDFSSTADAIVDEAKNDLVWFKEYGTRIQEKYLKYTIFANDKTDKNDKDEDKIDEIPKEDKCPIFMPCRYYSVGGCKILSTAHIEPGDTSMRPVVRSHMCYMCQKLYRRCLAHSMINCPVLDVLDTLYEHYNFEREGENDDEEMPEDPLDTSTLETTTDNANPATQSKDPAQPVIPAKPNDKPAAASNEHILS